MADSQPTTTDEQLLELSPEIRLALDLLLILAGPDTDTTPPLPAHADREDSTGSHGTRMLVEIHAGADPTRDPRFLGAAPFEEQDGTCSFCGDPYHQHWDQDTEQYLPGDEWHRRDYAGGDGFYSDEIPAVTR